VPLATPTKVCAYQQSAIASSSHVAILSLAVHDRIFNDCLEKGNSNRERLMDSAGCLFRHLKV
jgi:hypothetical protein